jgi:type IV pilus assembly protein PilE
MRTSMRGMTLIELMIVIVILSIVTTWGYSSYRDTVVKSRRAEGLGELLALADRLERYYSDRGTYIGATLGTSTTAVYALNSERGYYQFSLDSLSTIAYSISAAPQGKQADDTRCGTFTMGSDGTKTVSGTLNDNECWK